MKLLVLKPIKMKKKGAISDLSPGQTVEVKDPEKATPLIRGGYLKPIPPDSSGRSQAVLIWSEVVQDDLGLLLDPAGAAFIPEGATVYTPEEIRNLKDATPEEVQAVHMVKKTLSGNLVMVREREGQA